jgi:hypothetical protein
VNRKRRERKETVALLAIEIFILKTKKRKEKA